MGRVRMLGAMITVVVTVAFGIGAILWRRASRGPDIAMPSGWWLLPMAMLGFVLWWVLVRSVF